MNNSFITICDSFSKSYHDDERLNPDSYLIRLVCLSVVPRITPSSAGPPGLAMGSCQCRARVVIALTKYDLKQFITQYLGKTDTFKKN